MENSDPVQYEDRLNYLKDNELRFYDNVVFPIHFGNYYMYIDDQMWDYS